MVITSRTDMANIVNIQPLCQTPALHGALTSHSLQQMSTGSSDESSAGILCLHMGRGRLGMVAIPLIALAVFMLLAGVAPHSHHYAV